TTLTELAPLPMALAASGAMTTVETIADVVPIQEAADMSAAVLTAPVPGPAAQESLAGEVVLPPEIVMQQMPVAATEPAAMANAPLLSPAESPGMVLKAGGPSPPVETGDRPVEVSSDLQADVQDGSRVVAVPKAHPVTPAYWRLVLEGVMAGQNLNAAEPAVAAPANSSADTLPIVQAAQSGVAIPAQSPSDGADPAPNVPPQIENLALPDAEEATARGEIAADQPDASRPPEDKARQRAPDSATALRSPLMPQTAFVPLSQVDLSSAGPSLPPAHHAHVSAVADALPAMAQAGSGGADLSIRAASIAQVQTEAGQDVTEIRLDPEELGRLRITLDGEGDSLRVRVEVERPETLDMLRRNGDRLAETLREAGYDQADMQFSSWSEQRHSAAAQTRPDIEMLAEPEPLLLSPVPSPLLARPSALVAGLNLRL
ncbi:flagellar hook-length control protein FliK, partial [Gemmobacter sp.]|uniref:flagellar hook-length control protein FliK n=1 Tax=Gemmobacter sp. TaxID=1898957 RepID=UPI0025C3CDB7